MNYLIIGGSGFIGINLVNQIIKSDNKSKVVIYDKIKTDNFKHNSNVKFIKRKHKSLKKNLANINFEIDTIIHLGGVSAPSEKPNFNYIIEKDLLFTHELIQYSKLKKIKSFVYFSSGGTIYGDNITGKPKSETDFPNPKCGYALSKSLNESIVKSICNSFGINHIIIRPSNPYGPWQKKFNIQGVISTFLYRVFNNEELFIIGSTKNTKDYIFIDDLTDLTLKLIKNNCTGIYNISRNKSLAIKEIIEKIELITETKVGLNQIKADENLIHSFSLDNSKVLSDINELKYNFTSLDDGIALTWRWIQNFDKK